MTTTDEISHLRSRVTETETALRDLLPLARHAHDCVRWVLRPGDGVHATYDADWACTCAVGRAEAVLVGEPRREEPGS